MPVLRLKRHTAAIRRNTRFHGLAIARQPRYWYSPPSKARLTDERGNVMIRTLALMLCAFTAVSAADLMGTWKMNTAKSKYEGMPAPKEQTVTYTAKGAGYDYAAKGISNTGSPISAAFTFTKDGEETKATGFPYWDSMVLKNGMGAKSSVELKRGGKAVGTAARTISADGKLMTVVGKVTLTDGKQATYNAVYDRQ